MSKFVSTGALERAVREQLRTGESLEQRRASEGYDALQELETQYQVPLWGIATDAPTWQKFTLSFDVQFMFAPEQRDSSLTAPHFSFGPVVSGVPWPDELTPDPDNPDSLVAVFCQVVDWIRDRNNDAIVGAVLGVGVSTLGGAALSGSGGVKFNGYVHLTFTGFGTMIETDPTLS